MAIQTATASDVRHLCGEVMDWKLNAILGLEPSVGDVAAAASRAQGQDEVEGEPRTLEGLAAQVYDVLVSDEAAEDEG